SAPARRSGRSTRCSSARTPAPRRAGSSPPSTGSLSFGGSGRARRMPPERSAGPPCVVAVLRAVSDRHAAAIEAVDPRVRVVRVTDRTTWLREAPETEIIMGFRPLRDGAVGSRHLRWVQALWAGVENLCQDVARTDIRSTNNHDHAHAIADHGFGFLSPHTRRLW